MRVSSSPSPSSRTTRGAPTPRSSPSSKKEPHGRIVSALLLAAALGSCTRAERKASGPPPSPVTAAPVESMDVPLEVTAVGHVTPTRAWPCGRASAARSRGGLPGGTGREGGATALRARRAALLRSSRRPREPRARPGRAREARGGAAELVGKDYVTRRSSQGERERRRAPRHGRATRRGRVARLNVSTARSRADLRPGRAPGPRGEPRQGERRAARRHQPDRADPGEVLGSRAALATSNAAAGTLKASAHPNGPGRRSSGN